MLPPWKDKKKSPPWKHECGFVLNAATDTKITENDGTTLQISEKSYDKNDEEEVEALELDPNSKTIDLSHHRIQKFDGILFMKKLEDLCLRSNIISRIENLSSLVKPVELDLYDNQIAKIENLDSLVNLQKLDLSNNLITKLEGLSTLRNLKTLHVMNNKIAKIEGLENLTELHYLELGDNRIKKLKGLENCTKIEQLLLGGNSIKRIENLDNLMILKMLCLPSNSIIKIENLNNIIALTELYLSQNGIKFIENLDKLADLEVLDLNYNRIERIQNISHLKNFTDFWASHNKISDFKNVGELSKLSKLTIVYLEFCPIAKKRDYRRNVITQIPYLKRLDNEFIAIKSPRFIDVYPTQLKFQLSKRGPTKTTLQITNICGVRIAWRIRPSITSLYSAKPACGFLTSNEAQTIQVEHSGSNKYSDEHQFNVEAMEAKDDEKDRQKVWEEHRVTQFDLVQSLNIFTNGIGAVSEHRSNKPSSSDKLIINNLKGKKVYVTENNYYYSNKKR